MMSLNEFNFNYADTDNLQILEMPYKGGNLSMLVLLPKGSNLNNLENSLTREKLTQWRSNLREQQVDVYMPKFSFTTQYSLAGNLREMGMPSAFSSGLADFSGMDGTRNLFINVIVHKAYIGVSEHGTEAAAATGVGAAGGIEMNPTIFRAAHPFIFLIQDRGTGTILFFGRLINPA